MSEHLHLAYISLTVCLRRFCRSQNHPEEKADSRYRRRRYSRENGDPLSVSPDPPGAAVHEHEAPGGEGLRAALVPGQAARRPLRVRGGQPGPAADGPGRGLRQSARAEYGGVRLLLVNS